ncbi:hypothetical protein Ocin01_04858 [Orchesella cincta]|uniref:Uncharacterized protein n=1 Tax=Orchesella cincta TaxID=48709 RepID=A0A1D2N9A8_ORCCI|nr:hypothetical protein Ocin01_04858 [Orchesella cincta]
MVGFIGHVDDSGLSITAQVYFTDGTKEGVLAIDKYGGGSNNIRTLYQNKSVTKEPRGIKAVSGLSVQVTCLTNPCAQRNNGRL